METIASGAPVSREILLAGLAPEWPEDPRPAIRALLREEKVVVLDDDPTGTQTVHDVPVLTEWSVELLRAELEHEDRVCYLLTNSRSLPRAEAEALSLEIGRQLREAARLAGRPFVVVSRSDSTLRGHFPAEVAALARGVDEPLDGWLLVPFFLEGGRYTINDVHYVAAGELLVPAGMTEFARDASFGYRASNLREWVAEKTGGRIQADEVVSISLDDIRLGGPEVVTQRLLNVPQGTVCVVNAASTRDVEVFVQGLLVAEGQGRRFLYRTAASFVAARAAIEPRPLLTAAELSLPAGGGLTLVGSYVPRTTEQVAAITGLAGVERVELDVRRLLGAGQREAVIAEAAEQVGRVLKRSGDVVLMTSRELVTGADAERSLAIGGAISSGLVAVVQALPVRPRYIVAKGGITSSDVATRGLGMRRALVRGQILPGVPVWQAGLESRYPGLTYIVFPGNVGGPRALAEVIERLRTTGR